MKIFEEEFYKIFTKLKERQKFSFSKFADGEWMMINGIPVNNGEFNYTTQEEFFRKKLIESFRYKDKNYYVGISCPCCQGFNHQLMKNFSEQSDQNLTFANLFVNNNYKLYKEHFINEYKNWDVHLVANKNSIVDNLPFGVEKFYPVENTAWKFNYDLIETIKSFDYKDKLFLFAAGPFGNMLSHQLWESNQNNTYLDIGSTLNPWLKSSGFHRTYFLDNSDCTNKVCVWGE